jgi:hypothetical protein
MTFSTLNAYLGGYTRAEQLRYYKPIRPVWRLREPVARAVHRGHQVPYEPRSVDFLAQTR